MESYVESEDIFSQSDTAWLKDTISLHVSNSCMQAGFLRRVQHILFTGDKREVTFHPTVGMFGRGVTTRKSSHHNESISQCLRKDKTSLDKSIK